MDRALAPRYVDLPPLGHNGGPPLEEEHVPPWGRNGIGTYFAWEAAHRAARKSIPPYIAVFLARKADKLGLTYDEYLTEILERGRYLQPSDAERIRRIKEARR